ncbi:hypothetical protein SLS62_004729 [Diatrype stigma]|uniref:HMG box domain-containing protein n=1 Tax=Diatrype stigma TaxID=117547 RepID=A0AAN9UQM2_9PEZI
MLTSIGRAATRRLAVTASRRAAVTQVRVAACGLGQQLNLSQSSLNRAKGYASAAQTKTVAKTTAAKPKKTTAAKTTTKAKAPAKGVKAKAKPATKTKAKAKPATKAKSKSKAKPAVKAKAKKSRAKPLSEAAKERLERKQLKQAANYTEPPSLANSAWKAYVVEQTKARTQSPSDLRGNMAEISAAWKSLPASEIRRFEQLVEQNKQANAAAYKAWVESQKPADIILANNARYMLKRKYNIPKCQLKVITDDRLPKRPTTAYLHFTKARWTSGDYSDLLSTAGAKQVMTKIGSEWKTLSEAEKKPYIDLAKVDYERYSNEVSFNDPGKD